MNFSSNLDGMLGGKVDQFPFEFEQAAATGNSVPRDERVFAAGSYDCDPAAALGAFRHPAILQCFEGRGL